MTPHSHAAGNYAHKCTSEGTQVGWCWALVDWGWTKAAVVGMWGRWEALSVWVHRAGWWLLLLLLLYLIYSGLPGRRLSSSPSSSLLPVLSSPVLSSTLWRLPVTIGSTSGQTSGGREGREPFLNQWLKAMSNDFHILQGRSGHRCG